MSAEQSGFVDAFLDPGMRSLGRLAKLDAVIDWAPVEALAGRLRGSDQSRPPDPPGTMLRALYLQALYDLSDPGLEDSLRHRSDFRAFCGFRFDRPTPDETMLCRFRLAAIAAGVMQQVLSEVNRQLEARGLMLKKGTLIDASIVEAASRRPAQVAGPQAELPRDPEARFTREGGRSCFGWRLHVDMDQGSGLLHSVVVTAANVNASGIAERLIRDDERCVYADRGYESRHRRRRLKARGIKDRMMHRRHKHLPELPPWQRLRNRLIGRIRAPVDGKRHDKRTLHAAGLLRVQAAVQAHDHRQPQAGPPQRR